MPISAEKPTARATTVPDADANSDAELDAKYRELVAPVLGAEAARRLNDQIRMLERLPVCELALC